MSALEDALVMLGLPDDGMNAHRDDARRYGPHVKVVHRLDVGNRLESRSHRLECDMRRRGLEKDIDGFADKTPGAADDPVHQPGRAPAGAR